MADDGLKLIDRLGLTKNGRKVHIMGASMGGMIVQLMAIKAKEILASANILYSNCGGRDVVPQGFWMTLSYLYSPASDSEAHLMKYRMEAARRLTGDYPVEPELEAVCRMLLTRSPDDSPSLWRQVWAILRSTSRGEQLRQLNPDPIQLENYEATYLPVTIIHGMEDAMIPVINAVRLANFINRSKLVTFPRMGHSIPGPLVDLIADEVALHIAPTPATMG
ncbi:hypothetical protein AGDE_11568 [Angomonas deanei]|nr:hypothetical protein AGDE_11568 [Angomonas deanei]|eukprot:EPY26045.1 hypothetical protein AGDE_11568 [Angomonas deanei]